MSLLVMPSPCRKAIGKAFVSVSMPTIRKEAAKPFGSTASSMTSYIKTFFLFTDLVL